MMMNYVHYKTPGHISWKTTTVLLRGEENLSGCFIVNFETHCCITYSEKKKKELIQTSIKEVHD